MLTLAELYDEFESGLRRYAMSLVRDADRADDLVQDAFVRAVGHLQLLAQLNRYQQRAWLNRVLKNLFLDEQRAYQRREALFARLAGRAGTDLSPEILSPDIFELVPERYRELLHQRYVLGMSGEEIARTLGIPAATVRSRLHLAIKWLRAHQSQIL